MYGCDVAYGDGGDQRRHRRADRGSLGVFLDQLYIIRRDYLKTTEGRLLNEEHAIYSLYPVIVGGGSADIGTSKYIVPNSQLNIIKRSINCVSQQSPFLIGYRDENGFALL